MKFQGRSKVGGEAGMGWDVEKNVSGLHNSLYPQILWFLFHKTRKSALESIPHMGLFVGSLVVSGLVLWRF